MEVKERVIKLVAKQLGFEPRDIREDYAFQTDLGADSIDMADIVLGVEAEFGLKIDEKEIGGLATVGDLINKVENLRMHG